MGLFLDEYNKAKVKYQELVDELGDYTSGCRRAKSISFALTDENRVLEKLKLLNENKEESSLGFGSVKEAVAFLKSVTSFPDRRKQMINNATEVYLFTKKIREINRFVKENPFLGNECMYPDHREAGRAAKEYLNNAPSFSALYNKDAQVNIWTSCCFEFTKAEMEELLKEFSPHPDIIEGLPVFNNEKYLANLSAIKSTAEILFEKVEECKVRLKGVTFNNDDGSSRQEYLKKLQEACKTGPQLLRAHKWTYNGDPAIKVYWGEKEIGGLPAAFAKELAEKYAHYEVELTVENVAGGDDFNYGCEVNVVVLGEAKNKLDIADFFAKKIKEEVENTTIESPDTKTSANEVQNYDTGERETVKEEPDDITEELDF